MMCLANPLFYYKSFYQIWRVSSREVGVDCCVLFCFESQDFRITTKLRTWSGNLGFQYQRGRFFRVHVTSNCRFLHLALQVLGKYRDFSILLTLKVWGDGWISRGVTLVLDFLGHPIYDLYHILSNFLLCLSTYCRLLVERIAQTIIIRNDNSQPK